MIFPVSAAFLVLTGTGVEIMDDYRNERVKRIKIDYIIIIHHSQSGHI